MPCALDFRTHQEWCQRRGASARGRVLFAIMSIRFRIDKNRGDVASLKKLINLEPASFKMKDMSELVYDILHITTNLDIDDL